MSLFLLFLFPRISFYFIKRVGLNSALVLNWILDVPFSLVNGVFEVGCVSTKWQMNLKTASFICLNNFSEKNKIMFQISRWVFLEVFIWFASVESFLFKSLSSKTEKDFTSSVALLKMLRRLILFSCLGIVVYIIHAFVSVSKYGAPRRLVCFQGDWSVGTLFLFTRNLVYLTPSHPFRTNECKGFI